MRAHQNTWGRVSQAWKMGYGIWKMVCALLKGSKVGMPADAQASQLDLTVHVLNFPIQEGEADIPNII